ncbi:L,D-transpeptidase [Longispora sp. K20-0274]|uniref:L,D-transpeptidase n=1 Tax=Longispora sp. K20-0274 TaxID=3088255 RepID=UPI00399A1829
MDSPLRRYGRLWIAALACCVLVALTGAVLYLRTPDAAPRAAVPTPPPAPTSAPATTSAAVPPPASLPVIDYNPAPKGFPADPEPAGRTRTAEGLHARSNIGVYDAPGGTPLAFLAPTILGVRVTVPIVARQAGWVAVLLPSANRTIGWTPPGDWELAALRDQLVVHKGSHTMEWYRDDALVKSWPVTLGTRATPTPLGRTFVLGRSRLAGDVYADTDVFALGAIPDDPEAVPAGLRGAHIGIHTWYNDYTLGKDDTDGCIRLTKAGQQQLLQEIAPGTSVVVLD